ncbi:MAG: HAMP domain-containing histidine kinase [Anaerolineae bacterium]|nr:HAMP domain-containing histidine kinase [Anaerolineae bacterium]
MKTIRQFKSLRAQLPISFAAIALLTTTLIGAVLLAIIWNYYGGLEKQYLESNVRGTANSLSRIAENSGIQAGDSLSDFTDVIQNQSRVAAFLVQCRVRVLDTNNMVIYDTGSPSQSWNITVPKPKEKSQQPPPLSEENVTEQPAFSIEPSENKPPQQGENPPAYSFQANPIMFGYLLMQESTDEFSDRSSLVVTAPFHDADKNTLGFVELSESPEYGRQIIENVIRGWAIASLVGVAVSTLLGLLVSRGLIKPLVDLEHVASEMRDGNYEIRSPIFKPSELASLSETFNQMAAHIEQNIETLRRFVSDAAHEIRTPLTSLRADLNLALAEKNLNESRPLVERSLEQIERLDRLSHDLLDLSRLEAKNEKVDYQKLNLNQLLSEICETHASAAEQAGIDFEIQLPQKTLFIDGDPEQLKRAVSNLLSNAVKFSQTEGKVVLSMHSEPHAVTIQVQDNGIGIPSEERDHLFNRFHRGQNTQKYPGSGLGLAIARAIVEKHGGEIGLLPRKGWTIFYIRLPLSNLEQE